MDEAERERRSEALLAQLRALLAELAEVQPPNLLTVPLALPLELAALMVERARGAGVDVASVYVSCLLHGLLHSALENGEQQEARRIARLIRHGCDEGTWATFVRRHPEVEGG